MNSPGALNVKAGIKTREHDSRCEHCISREPHGYYFGERLLLPECSSRWLWSDMFSTWTLLPGAASTKGCWTFFLRKRPCAVRTTTGASGLLPGIRRRNHPTSRPPIKSTGLEIELTKRALPSQSRGSIISFGYLSFVKSVFVFVYCFFE